MFSSQYQDGPCVEVWSAQGRQQTGKRAPACKGMVRKYDKHVKGYVLEAPSAQSKLQYPSSSTLGLTQSVLCLQLNTGENCAIEVNILDSDKCRRRIVLSTACKELKAVTPLHCRLPLQVVQRNWITLCIDLDDLCARHFRCALRSISGVTLTGIFKLRRIFTLRDMIEDPLVDELPRSVDFAPGVNAALVILDAQSLLHNSTKKQAERSSAASHGRRSRVSASNSKKSSRHSKLRRRTLTPPSSMHTNIPTCGGQENRNSNMWRPGESAVRQEALCSACNEADVDEARNGRRTDFFGMRSAVSTITRHGEATGTSYSPLMLHHRGESSNPNNTRMLDSDKPEAANSEVDLTIPSHKMPIHYQHPIVGTDNDGSSHVNVNVETQHLNGGNYNEAGRSRDSPPMSPKEDEEYDRWDGHTPVHSDHPPEPVDASRPNSSLSENTVNILKVSADEDTQTAHAGFPNATDESESSLSSSKQALSIVRDTIEHKRALLKHRRDKLLRMQREFELEFGEKLDIAAPASLNKEEDNIDNADTALKGEGTDGNDKEQTHNNDIIERCGFEFDTDTTKAPNVGSSNTRVVLSEQKPGDEERHSAVRQDETTVELAVAPSKSSTGFYKLSPPSSNTSESEIELLFDPILKLYYDPRSKKYYQATSRATAEIYSS
ncbi:MAG: hypothetical protein MHM6MM_005464 [Cercozoa sp. M6MM]